MCLITISEIPPEEEEFDEDNNARDGTTKCLKFDKDDDATTLRHGNGCEP